MDPIPEMKFETPAQTQKAAETITQSPVAEVPTLETVPTLELTKAEEKPVVEAGPDYSILTEEEQKIVHEFAQKIDITNPNLSTEYGAGAQKNIADFSDAALESVRTQHRLRRERQYHGPFLI